MRNLSVKGLSGSLLLSLVLSVPQPALSQRYIYRDYEQARVLFDQVRTDLQRAQQDAFPRDTDTIEKARGELNELQREWEVNEYTPRQADNVVSAMQRVLSEDHLSFRNHSRLSDDLSNLRKFRDAHNVAQSR